MIYFFFVLGGHILLYEVVDFVNYTFIDVLSYLGRVPGRVVDMGSSRGTESKYGN